MVCTYLMSFYMSMRTISITALKILTAIFVPYQNPIIPRFKYDKEKSVKCVMYVIRKVIEMKLALACLSMLIPTHLVLVGRAAPFYVGWSGSGGGGCSNASNAPYADSDDIKIYNT